MLSTLSFACFRKLSLPLGTSERCDHADRFVIIRWIRQTDVVNLSAASFFVPDFPQPNLLICDDIKRRKERACPELVGSHRRARMVILAGEVGGRPSPGRSCSFYEGEWNKLGGPGGAQCCLVRLQGRLLHQSWSVAPRWVQMAQPLCPQVEGDFRHSGLGP